MDSKLSDPDAGCGEHDGGEEVCCGFIVARGDAAEVLEFAEEAFDEVAVAVDLGIDGALNLAIAGSRDVRASADRRDLFDDRAGVVARSATRSRPGGRPSINAATAALSDAWPGARRMRTGKPSPSTSTLILVLSPPRERPMACSDPQKLDR